MTKLSQLHYCHLANCKANHAAVVSSETTVRFCPRAATRESHIPLLRARCLPVVTDRRLGFRPGRTPGRGGARASYLSPCRCARARAGRTATPAGCSPAFVLVPARCITSHIGRSDAGGCLAPIN